MPLRLRYAQGDVIESSSEHRFGLLTLLRLLSVKMTISFFTFKVNIFRIKIIIILSYAIRRYAHLKV